MLLAALLLAVVCGCGQLPALSGLLEMDGASSTPPKPGGSLSGQPPEQPPAQTAETAVLEEVWEGTVAGEGYELPYSYRLPRIDADTPGAHAINEEIGDFYGSMMDACLEEAGRGELPYCTGIDYEAFRSGGVLSLLLKAAYAYGPYEYSVYLYDQTGGERLQNADLLRQQHLTEADCLAALRRAAARCFDELCCDNWGETEDINSGGFEALRSAMLAQLQPDTSLYLDDGGALCAIAPIGASGDGGLNDQPLVLDTGPGSAPALENELDFLTVDFQGREMTLRFETTAQGARFLENAAVTPGKDYPVQGLYSSYTRAYAALAGPAETPWLFLLTSEGRVEYIDLGAGMAGGYFCAGGPLLETGRILDLFTTRQGGDGVATVCGYDQRERPVDLLPLVETAQHLMPSCFRGGWDTPLVGSPKGQTNLQLWQGGNAENVRLAHEFENPPSELYGIFRYLGMAEQGMAYGYQFWPKDGAPLSGVAALLRQETPQGSVLRVTELGGSPLLGARAGDVTELLPGAAG